MLVKTTQDRSHIALHVALLAVMLMAVVAPVLLPDTSPVVLAYTGLRLSYDNVPQSLGWSVYDSDNVVDIESVFAECRCAPLSYIQNGWVIFDLGASFVVDYVISANANSGELTVQYSSNAISWSNPVNIGGFNFGEHTAYFSPPDVGVTLRYLLFSTTNDNAQFNYFYVNILSDTPPTPTPFPTASPFPPQPTACVTGTPIPSATPPRTPTPFRQTPGPTSTPAGTATPIPQTGFVSDLAKFDSTLIPWTALATTRVFSQLASWSSENGPDTLPGTAFMPFTIDYDGVISTTTAPSGGIIFYRPQGFPTPIRLTGNFNSDPVQQFHYNYVRVFYLDPDYNGVGQAAFVHAGIKSISSVWSQLDFTLTPSGGSGRVTAIIVDAVASGTPFDAPGGLTSYGYTHEGGQAGVFADNVKFYAGANAIATSYPVCPGTGGAGKPPIATKQCKVSAIVTNVYAGCTAPTDALDLAGWITYYFCRLWHYLWFVNENRAQITDILDRQNSNEPIGTLGEMDDALGVLYETVSSVGAVYSGNDYYTVDWASLFAGWDNFDFNNVTSGWQTTPDPIDEQGMMSACPSTFANATNPEVRKGACFISYLLKVKLRWWVLLQYALDASAIIYALSVILEWLGQHG